MADIRQGTVETGAGPITFLAGGTPAPDRPALVLLHGIQGSASAWRAVMEPLAEDGQVFAPNLRGRGGSHTPDRLEDYTPAGFAADVDAFAATIDGPFVLVGWSMGVLVALEYVARYGTDRLAGLGLVGGSAHPGGDCHWFRGETPDAIATEAAARAKALNLTETATPFAVAGSWLAARAADHRATLARVDVPTLVLHGTDDDQCPLSHGRVIADGIAGAELAVWPGCGHNPMAHDPAGVAVALGTLRGRA
ncbi:alpha/beta fold hydrolase [Azospirillum sp. RWY-5-1]|uniref:Alpha/beta fold hydrolase n=1 Tax=Azospirillum oleiclasticum TaxID=2735135 RepID=A0ABX2TH40_9PROT|nr:alpha/beta fold hydrolase [Azospirillum oleiclasticum]NYZ15454.1 alpha/beta fold hydrolase [Azospirillum oleiclasticum]NYZ22477.1 alpha/beta fold hydrolase [Azospirillum oleiclasticum]